MKVLGIGAKRTRSVQGKIIRGENLTDNRGKHQNHVVKLTKTLQDMILEYCKLIPHKQSHYRQEYTQKYDYFENADLTFPVLYKLFLEYYTKVSGNQKASLSFSTHCNYFNHEIPFSFN